MFLTMPILGLIVLSIMPSRTNFLFLVFLSHYPTSLETAAGGEEINNIVTSKYGNIVLDTMEGDEKTGCIAAINPNSFLFDITLDCKLEVILYFLCLIIQRIHTIKVMYAPNTSNIFHQLYCQFYLKCLVCLCPNSSEGCSLQLLLKMLSYNQYFSIFHNNINLRILQCIKICHSKPKCNTIFSNGTVFCLLSLLIRAYVVITNHLYFSIHFNKLSSLSFC